jgi:hypothetical protein
MMQSNFVKLIAIITNVLTGSSEEELQLSLKILTEFSRMTEVD